MTRQALMEEDAFFGLLEGATRDARPFNDELYSRCCDALSGPQKGSERDAAVLVRQALRRQAEYANVQRHAVADAGFGFSTTAEWRLVGVDAYQQTDNRMRLEARPWQPAWIEGGSWKVDISCLAGTEVGNRRGAVDRPLADPSFQEATGYTHYSTLGQAAAARAAMTLDPGDTLIAILPTGSGKTEVALALSHVRPGTTVIVVPTVALAIDFERRFREVWARHNPDRAKDAGRVPFAWTSETPESDRSLIRKHIVDGRLPWLVTSPEALAFGLSEALVQAAMAGRLAGFVVDEAHLITQWGRDFRADFRELPQLRERLVNEARASGHPAFPTLLLSATLGAQEVEDLVGLFGEGGRMGLVAANELRPEPDFWLAEVTDSELRRTRVFEALDHLPRPLILYVTKPDNAESWAKDLRERGFQRLAVVTGRTVGQDRRDVLEGMRAGEGHASRYDIVVATSAFGLGIDYSGVRSVVHACIPETIDRWYQEVGRAGRDGDVSTALLLPSTTDFKDAESLGLKVLLEETAQARWDYMWRKRREIGGRAYVNISGARRNVEQGSYNRRWNRQILQALDELGKIQRKSVPTSLAHEMGLVEEIKSGSGRYGVVDEWEEVSLLWADMAGFFRDGEWEDWRSGQMIMADRRSEAMRAVIRGEQAVCRAIEQAYDPGERLRELFPEAAMYMAPKGDCGACPACRASGRQRPARRVLRPHMRWPTPTRDPRLLDRFFREIGAESRMAWIVDDSPDEVASWLVPSLWQIGFRYFAGIGEAALQEVGTGSGEVLLLDAEPPELGWAVPPLPGFVLLRTEPRQSLLVPVMRPKDESGEPLPLLYLSRTRCAPQWRITITAERARNAISLTRTESA